MDLTYMPGELDVKNIKKSNASDLKREHDSVDDFEHLDPELSPVDNQSKHFSGEEKVDILRDREIHNLPESVKGPGSDKLDLSHNYAEAMADTGSIPKKNTDLLDFDSEPHQGKTDLNVKFIDHGKSNLLDFEITNVKSDSGLDEHSLNKSFISAEVENNTDKTEHGKENWNVKNEDNFQKTQDPIMEDDANICTKTKDEKDIVAGLDGSDLKSMKEADALPQYDIKYEPKESLKNDDFTHQVNDKPETPEPEFSKPETPEPEFSKPETKLDTHEPVPKPEIAKEFKIQEETKEMQPSKELPIDVKPAQKPEPVPVGNLNVTVKKFSISDLDDIIGPEDVFKRMGLVEALVYWRDPKKSGVVFGGIMTILFSLCFMSLISVIAYSSLFVLTGTICFRIYKNILQAVQKTSEGHPFKEFLELELSLPQDKVREIVDTAVVHVNAAILELRRLFLVEDLIDSIKFGVCLWCLTYVGAIFNGMTLVILSFVALFTVPKIYENNKASIDQYIDMGRSKVADITSKVKAAVPIGKKEPEKDKEQ